MNKIIPFSTIGAVSAALKVLGKSVVTTNGTFDLLHIGHIDSLEHSKCLGDILIVGLNSDESVKRYKGHLRPIVPVAERARMLSSLTCVDYVVIFEQDTPMELLMEIKPSIHCKGSEYSDGSRPIPEKEFVEPYGGKMHYIDLTINKSTTNIINKILNSQQ